MAAEDVIARLRVEGQAAFTQAMGGASTSAKSAGTEQAEAGKKAGVSAGGLLKAAAAAGALYKGYGFLKGSINTTVNLAKSTAAFSRASGLDQKASQAWVVTAQQRNIDTKQLQMGMATLGRNLGGLGTATKASGAAFQKLGIDQAALIKMPMQERMSHLANAFQALPDGVDKAALAQKLFGRSGQSLLPILNSGADALNQQLDAAGRLVPVNAKGSKSALELAKNQRELGMAMTGIKTAIGTALLPVISGLAKAFLPIVTGITELMGKSAAFRVVIYALTAAFAALAIAVIAAALPLGAIAAVVGAVVGAIGIIPIAIAAAVAAVVTACIVMYNKVGWFRTGVDAAVAGVVAAFNWIVGAGRAMGGAIAGAFTTAVGAVGKFVGSIGQMPGKVSAAASSAVSALTGAFSGAVAKLAGIGKSIVDAIVNAIKGGAGAIKSAVESIIPNPGDIASGALGGVKSAISSLNPFGTGGLVAAQTGLNVGGGGGRQLVGERGAELASFPSGTRITPLPPPMLRPSQLGAGGGGDVVVPVYLDRRQIAEAIGSYTADQKNAR